MVSETNKKAVGIFAKRTDVELALAELKAAGYSMDKISVVARNAEQEGEIAGVEVKEHTGNKADEGAVVGAATGTAVGGLTGLLVGLGLVAIPAVGPIMLAGAGATALATTLAGSAIGAAAGSLGGALVGLGIPEDEAKIYSDLVDQGYYLVIIEGEDEEILLAEKILRNRNVENWRIFQNSTPTREGEKNAAGLLFKRMDVEHALADLQKTDFPMNQVSIVCKGLVLNDEFADVNVINQDDWVSLGVPEDIAGKYKYRMTLGDYLVVFRGTDNEIAAARNVLEAHGVNEFHVYTPNVVAINNNNPHGVSR